MKKISFMIIMIVTIVQGCTKGGENMPVFVEPSNSVSTNETPALEEEIAAVTGLEKLIYHVGPVDLEAHPDSETMLDSPLLMRFQLDKPMWIIGFEPKVVDGSGKTLPSELLHSALVSNMNEENPLCRKGSSGNPFVLASSLLTSVNFPEGYGYPISPKDTLEARIVFKNQTDESFVDVFYEIVLLAKPMNEFVALKNLKPMLVEFDPCNHSPLEIEPSLFTEKKMSYELPVSGNLLTAVGVLQDFGSTITLQKEDSSDPVWKTEAIVDENHHIEEMINNPFEDPSGIPLKEGEKIELSVGFDNFSDRWINDALPGVLLYLSGE